MRKSIVLIILLSLLKTGIGYSQDVNFKVGVKDSIQSEILTENRKVIVSLPGDYQTVEGILNPSQAK